MRGSPRHGRAQRLAAAYIMNGSEGEAQARANGGVSPLPTKSLRRIDQLLIDGPHPANRDDGRFAPAANHPVIVRGSRHAAHEASGRNGDARGRIEICAAVDPPSPGDDDAKPVGRIGMRSAHITWVPS